MNDTTHEQLLHIWLDANPGSSDADTTIFDVPGVSDLDLIAESIMAGHLGRYLPTTIRFATHPQPNPDKVRSIDTARMLRDRSIPHRRRYEIVPAEQTEGPDA